MSEYLELAKKLTLIAKIYKLGLIDEEEYSQIRRKIMQEYNVVSFTDSG